MDVILNTPLSVYILLFFQGCLVIRTKGQGWPNFEKFLSGARAAAWVAGHAIKVKVKCLPSLRDGQLSAALQVNPEWQ